LRCSRATACAVVAASVSGGVALAAGVVTGGATPSPGDAVDAGRGDGGALGAAGGAVVAGAAFAEAFSVCANATRVAKLASSTAMKTYPIRARYEVRPKTGVAEKVPKLELSIRATL
jgi:hypothetical protein